MSFERLLNESKSQRSSDYYDGLKKGQDWAAEKASFKILLRLTHWRKRPVRGPLVLAKWVSKALEDEEIYISYLEVFAGYVDVCRFQTSAFMTGFKDGCLDVFDRVIKAKREEEEQKASEDRRAENVAAANGSANGSANEAPWNGWYRGGKTRPWIMIAHGESEMEVLSKMVVAPNGDKMVLPRGQHPDQMQQNA